MTIFKRTKRFEKDPTQEEFIRTLNRLLLPCEREFTKDLDEPEYPVIFIVGTPRCGSTLSAQFLPSVLRLGYVSNLMARFFLTPSVGARLQAMLYEKTICDVDFNAEYGYTSEIESTHEFGYFWTRWFKFDDTHQVDDATLSEVNTKALRRELAGVEAVFNAPLLFKNLTCSLNISFLANCIPTVLFIHIDRSPLSVAESILKARKAANNDEDIWWSLRPKEFIWLKDLSKFEQIAGQIICTSRRINEQLEGLPKDQYIKVSYRNLCCEPKGVVELLVQKLARRGYLTKQSGHMLSAFRYSDERDVLPHKSEFQKAFTRVEKLLERPDCSHQPA